MLNYQLILKEFVLKLGCSEGDSFNQQGINKLLDKLANDNAGISQFNREVSYELFQQTSRNKDNKVILRDFINIVLQAIQLLSKSHIVETEKKLQNTTDKFQRQLEQYYLKQYKQDLMLLQKTFINMKDIYMLFLLHINQDFDDDLLKQSIELIVLQNQ